MLEGAAPGNQGRVVIDKTTGGLRFTWQDVDYPALAEGMEDYWSAILHPPRGPGEPPILWLAGDVADDELDALRVALDATVTPEVSVRRVDAAGNVTAVREAAVGEAPDLFRTTELKDGAARVSITAQGEVVSRGDDGDYLIMHLQDPHGIDIALFPGDAPAMLVVSRVPAAGDMPTPEAVDAVRRLVETATEQQPGIDVQYAIQTADQYLPGEPLEAAIRGAAVPRGVAAIEQVPEFSGKIAAGELAPDWVRAGEHPARETTMEGTAGVKLAYDPETGDSFVHFMDHGAGVEAHGTSTQQWSMADGGFNLLIEPHQVNIQHAGGQPLTAEQYSTIADALRRMGFPEETITRDWLTPGNPRVPLSEVAPAAPPARALRLVEDSVVADLATGNGRGVISPEGLATRLEGEPILTHPQAPNYTEQNVLALTMGAEDVPVTGLPRDVLLVEDLGGGEFPEVMEQLDAVVAELREEMPELRVMGDVVPPRLESPRPVPVEVPTAAQVAEAPDVHAKKHV
jgi:hypothetical protein